MIILFAVIQLFLSIQTCILLSLSEQRNRDNHQQGRQWRKDTEQKRDLVFLLQLYTPELIKY